MNALEFAENIKSLPHKMAVLEMAKNKVELSKAYLIGQYDNATDEERLSMEAFTKDVTADFETMGAFIDSLRGEDVETPIEEVEDVAE